MIDNDNDGWEDVSDPREVKALLGVKGVRDMGKTSSLPKAPPGGAAPRGAFDLDTPVTPPKGQAAQAAYTKVGAARAMLQQLHKVRTLYDKNFSAGGMAGAREFNPFSTTNQEFDGAVAAIPLLARQAFRVSGSGADSDRELKLISDALPNRWSFDASNKERFKTLDSVLRGFVTSYGGLAGYSPEQIKGLAAQNSYAKQRQLPKAPPRAAASSDGWTITRKK
jgi:hypothetical protein